MVLREGRRREMCACSIWRRSAVEIGVWLDVDADDVEGSGGSGGSHMVQGIYSIDVQAADRPGLLDLEHDITKKNA